MNFAWPVLLCAALLYALISGEGASIVGHLAQSAAEAVTLLITLAGAYALWSGVLGVFRASGALAAVTRMVKDQRRRRKWLYDSRKA